MSYVYKTMPSPVGTLKLIASDKGLAAILWQNDKPMRVRVHADIEDANHPVLIQAETELREYFAGRRMKFFVALDFIGTEFQKKVWQALVAIPFGETRSCAASWPRSWEMRRRCARLAPPPVGTRFRSSGPVIA